MTYLDPDGRPGPSLRRRESRRPTRTWALPAEPDCPVRDSEGRRWENTGDQDAPWQSGRIATTWPMLLTRGPLTEETP